MELLSRLAGDFAWPVTVIIIVLVLKQPITAALRSLESIRAPGGWEARFDRGVQEAAGLAEDLQSEATSDTPQQGAVPWVDSLQALVQYAPATAILEAWSNVEAEIVRLARPYGATTSTIRMARDLARGDVISTKVLRMLEEMSDLRNQAAHAPDPRVVSPEAAAAYVDVAAMAVAHLRGATSQPRD